MTVLTYNRMRATGLSNWIYKIIEENFQLIHIHKV